MIQITSSVVDLYGDIDSLSEELAPSLPFWQSPIYVPLKFDTFDDSLWLEIAEPSDETAIIDNKKFAADEETSDL